MVKPEAPAGRCGTSRRGSRPCRRAAASSCRCRRSSCRRGTRTCRRLAPSRVFFAAVFFGRFFARLRAFAVFLRHSHWPPYGRRGDSRFDALSPTRMLQLTSSLRRRFRKCPRYPGSGRAASPPGQPRGAQRARPRPSRARRRRTSRPAAAAPRSRRTRRGSRHAPRAARIAVAPRLRAPRPAPVPPAPSAAPAVRRAAGARHTLRMFFTRLNSVATPSNASEPLICASASSLRAPRAG